LPGNDDSGALSSWYVWNFVGLFPLPGQGIFFISRPLVDQVKFGSPSFRITVERESENAGNGAASVYLKRILLNGSELRRSFLYLEEVLRGGELRIELSKNPHGLIIDRLPPPISADT
jgi:putative alpha-1,2-mannosidase